MAEYPAMPLWTDAYLGDTTHLTTIEHGAYILLLMAMWRAGGTLPNDDRLLARYARLTAGQWKRVKPVLWPFFTVRSDEIMQGRLTDELKAVRQKSRRQSDNAKSRWLKINDTGDATAEPSQSHGNASLTHNHIEKELPNGSSKKKDSTKKGTRLPEDWKLPRQWGQWAVEAGMDEVSVRREADTFRDHWIAQPGAKGVKLDWQATWRNWIRRAKERTPKRAAGGNWRDEIW
jgi:uncharacterized protein YdaU (DUF1376 family)